MRLRFTPEAAHELDVVLAEISAHSPQGAGRVQSRIQKAVQLVAEHPYSGQSTSRSALRRIMATPYPYLIFYRVAEDEVIVIGVRHASRDPASMPVTS